MIGPMIIGQSYDFRQKWKGALVLAALFAAGCAHFGMSAPPPTNQANACAIFDERGRWQDPIFDAAKHWDITPGTLLAFMRQESSFRHDARPRDRNGRLQSTALGFSQALDGTWAEYERQRGRGDRRNIRHASDFMGWYLNRIIAQTHIDRRDARALYLAYHDGPGGYNRGSWRGNAALISIAGRVDQQASEYDDQLRDCHWWAMRRFRR